MPPRAEAEAIARWELPVFPGTPRCPEDVVLHTAQHLDDMEAAAYQEGFARGHAEGLAIGQNAGAQQVREQAARLSALIDHLARPLQQLDEEVERTLVALTIEVARRLVQQELQLDPGRVAAVVGEAMSALSGPAREVRVLAHPEDVPLLKEHLLPPDGAQEFRITADPTLMRGDCRVLSESAQVDARLDTRQANLAQSLIGDGE